MFERFRRVRGAKSRSHEGSGIGLALVEELVHLHGGSVDVRSEVGKGTAFTVRIPLGREHLDPAKVVTGARPGGYASVVDQYLAEVDSTIVRADGVLAPADNGSGKRGRILLADDNGDLRAYVARVLAPRHDVVAVRNGVEALDALRREPFDLVVSDVMMPEMDGFELIRCVRNDPALATIPFVMLSARAGEGAAIEGLQRGADDYLVKPFSSEELLARVYAQLNAAEIRERATAELRANEERFRTLAASMPHIVLEGDLERGVTFLSEAYGVYTGLPVESGYGLGWLAAVHPHDVAGAMRQWEAASASSAGFASEFRLRRADGAYRWHAGRALAQRDGSGRIVRFTGTITDIHDMRRSALERTFLSDASRILTLSLDLEATLQSLARFVVPQFGDWCQIDVRTREGRIRTVAIAHADPGKHALAQRLAGRVHLNPQAARGSPYTIRTGRTDLIDDPPAAAAEEAIADAAELAIYEQLGMASVVSVPLVAEGMTLGAISLLYGDSGRRYAADDVPVLEELGRRAGMAVLRATEFEREHRVAQSFQEASLPSELPTLHGTTFDAVYVPANDEAQVGGDWYDAVRLADGRVVVSIGDVAGNGLRAAVTMGNMRQIIRGIAQVHADPALMLDAADRALALEHPGPARDGFRRGLRSGRRRPSRTPRPAIRRRCCAIRTARSNCSPTVACRSACGKLPRTAGARSVGIEPGSYLVFYTDGLTEATRRPADGEERLRELLGEGSALLGARPAQAIRQALLGDAPAKDDVAILVVGVGTAGQAGPLAGEVKPIERWFFDATDARAGQSARRAFTHGLLARSAELESVHKAEVVFGELVGNAARYAPGPIEVTVDWSGTAPVLHVLDEGPGFHHVPALPRDVYSESGRGLFIISLLSEDFSVSKRPGGGSHARAVLSLYRRPFRRMR